MQPEIALTPARRKINFLHLAIILWVICAAIVSVRAYLKPYNHSVYHIYSHAVSNWCNGISTYQLEPSEGIPRDVYRYCPPATILFLPFYYLGDALGGVVWRLIGLAFFLYGFYRWFRSASNLGHDNKSLGQAFLLLIPLTLTSFNNGQVNLLMMGGLLLGLALVLEGKYFWAGCALSVGVIFKIFPLFIVFLMVLAFPWNFLPGFLFGILTLCVAPFLFQSPTYAYSQYVEWLGTLKSGDRSMLILEAAYRDFWLIIRYFNLPISHEVYRGIQVLTALGVSAVVLGARFKGVSTDKLSLLIVGLGFGWLTLFGPSTESSTYVILAPAFAYAILEVFRARLISQWIFSAMGVIFFILAIGAGVFAGANKIHAIGFHPMGAAFFFIQYLVFAYIWSKVSEDNCHHV